MPWLIPLILMAASMGANYQGQKKVDKARARAMGEARSRREAKEKETAQTAQSTADLLVKSASDEKTRAAELETKYKAAGQPPAAAGSMPLDALRSAPTSTTNTVQESRMAQRARAESDALTRGRAQLGAFGDVMVGNQIAAGRNAGDIDAVNAGVRNWNQFVLPAQLEHANTTGRQWNTFADVLQAASMLTSMGALSSGAKGGTETLAQSSARTAGDTWDMNQMIGRQLRNMPMPGY